jgi:glycosyltransferase involved in cell wall biosynthesis
MIPFVSMIIPAWNEEARISGTLQALQHGLLGFQGLSKLEIIVVDDGSKDKTYQEAYPWADALVRHSSRLGKGAAMSSGIRKAKGELLLFLDADLQESAVFAPLLLKPILAGEADMVIAKLPPPRIPGGFGLAKGMAAKGIYKLSGYKTTAPLSGQRALRTSMLEKMGKLANGFGIEIGLTIDAARQGFRIAEMDMPFRHREMGRDWQGFYHRGRQFVSVGTTLVTKWKEHKQWHSDGSLI